MVRDVNARLYPGCFPFHSLWTDAIELPKKYIKTVDKKESRGKGKKEQPTPPFSFSSSVAMATGRGIIDRHSTEQYKVGRNRRIASRRGSSRLHRAHDPRIAVTFHSASYIQPSGSPLDRGIRYWRVWIKYTYSKLFKLKSIIYYTHAWYAHYTYTAKSPMNTDSIKY